MELLDLCHRMLNTFSGRCQANLQLGQALLWRELGRALENFQSQLNCWQNSMWRIPRKARKKKKKRKLHIFALLSVRSKQ